MKNECLRIKQYNIVPIVTLVTLLEKLKNKFEIQKYNLQNDLRKGQGSLGHYVFRRVTTYFEGSPYISKGHYKGHYIYSGLNDIIKY